MKCTIDSSFKVLGVDYESMKVEVVMDGKAIQAKRSINVRLMKLSWALFFILIGGSFILENLQKITNSQKWGIIYAGSGAILLLLNMLRIFLKVTISKFTTGLGALGLIFGIATLLKLDFSIWAIAILIVGIIMLLDAARR